MGNIIFSQAGIPRNLSGAIGNLIRTSFYVLYAPYRIIGISVNDTSPFERVGNGTTLAMDIQTAIQLAEYEIKEEALKNLKCYESSGQPIYLYETTIVANQLTSNDLGEIIQVPREMVYAKLMSEQTIHLGILIRASKGVISEALNAQYISQALGNANREKYRVISTTNQIDTPLYFNVLPQGETETLQVLCNGDSNLVAQVKEAVRSVIPILTNFTR